MKKFLLVLLATALLGSFAFAEITGVGAPTVSGDVTATFGFDLDTDSTGFINGSSLTLVLPLLDGSSVKGGSDKNYGEITVDGIGWQLTNDGFYDVDEDDYSDDYTILDASISAKLVLDKFFVKLGNPGFSMNNVDMPANGNYTLDANLFKDGTLDDMWKGGISFGYASDMITVEAKVASKNNGYKDPSDNGDGDTDDYTDFNFFDNDTDEDTGDDTFTANEENEYAFGAAVTLAPMEGLSVPLSFFYAAEYGDPNVVLMGFGANPAFTLAPVTIGLPVDYVMYDEQYGFEIGPKVTYAFIEGGSNVCLQFIYAAYDDTLAANGVGHLKLTLSETETKGFVENLTATVAFEMRDFMDMNDDDSDAYWTVDADFFYNIGGLKPYVNFGYGYDETLDLGVGAKFLADFTGLDNTEITLDYTNGRVMENKAGTKGEFGRMTLAAKVAF